MKTIEECFIEAGSKFPFKVRGGSYRDFLEVVARSPQREWLAIHNIGNAEIISRKDGNNDVWSLHTEPRAKVKLYPYLNWDCINSKNYVEVNYFTSEQQARNWLDADYIGPHPTLEPIEVDAPCEKDGAE